VPKPTKFLYTDKATGKSENRPMQPSYLDKIYEGVVYPDDIAKQRARAQSANGLPVTDPYSGKDEEK
jgi:hypothetical protein